MDEVEHYCYPNVAHIPELQIRSKLMSHEKINGEERRAYQTSRRGRKKMGNGITRYLKVEAILFYTKGDDIILELK